MPTKRNSNESLLETYFREIGETPLLTPEKEKELVSRLAQGDRQARDHVVKANLRLVVNLARCYLNNGLNLEDLIEEGNLGLMRAAQSFDTVMGYRFSTYATYWINQTIRRAIINQGYPIRVPVPMTKLHAKWRRVSRDLAQKLGRQPTTQEMGKVLGLTKKKVGLVILADSAKRSVLSGATDEDVNDLLARAVDNGPLPEGQVEALELEEGIVGKLDDLTPPEASVIRLHFGLGGETQLTLRQIAKYLRVSWKTVRHLERCAFIKLAAWAGEDPPISHLVAASANTEPDAARTNGRSERTGKTGHCAAKANGVKKKINGAKTSSQSSPTVEDCPQIEEYRDHNTAAGPNGKWSAASLMGRRAAAAGRQSGHRRLIDPATCNRAPTPAESVFSSTMNAAQKRLGSFLSPTQILIESAQIGYYYLPGPTEPDCRECETPALKKARPELTEAELALIARQFDSMLAEYKQTAGRRFPTWSEVLEVMISLGYRKVKVPEPE